ncbi:chitotriosidase-1-like isoform X2 [Armigeres subalbatus]|uniref:chitotriosidase-1-like isoform X2 n=1 Tax=Armigeres subalbatus TaxID=124917 RepID=UPI002ED12253
MIKIVFFLIIFIFHHNAAQNIVCYYDSHVANYPNPLLPDALSAAKCTHYTYIGIGLHPNGEIRFLNDKFDTDIGFLFFQSLRTAETKLMILLGGIHESSATFSKVVANYQDTLINNIALFLTRYNFDGIDIDWRYPASRGGQASDKANFQKFIIRLRARLNMINKLLAVSVSPNKSVFSGAYDSTTLSLYADMINVFAFNFTDVVETTTSNISPLYTDMTSPASVNSSIVDWISTKVRKSKLNLVVATYARTYTLARETRTAVASPISGLGDAGSNTQKAGYLAQYELCPLKTNYATIADGGTATVYYTKGSSWISSETEDTLAQKYSYAVINGLGGVAIYTLDWDDWTNDCGMGSFPSAALARDYLYSGTNGA